MKTILIINSREVGDYSSKRIEIKNKHYLIPREGERITFNNESFDVQCIHYDFDEKVINISVI